MALVGTPALDASSPVRLAERQVRAPLLGVAAVVAVGIGIDRYQTDRLTQGTGPWLGCVGWWLAAALLLGLWAWLARRQSRASAAIVLIMAIGCVAGCWHHWCWNYFDASDIGRFATEESYPCCIEAIALASPERGAAPKRSPYRAIPTGEKSELPLRVVRIRNGDQWHDAQGECEVIIEGQLLGVNANDRIELFGQLRLPAAKHNPGQFDFAAHARGDRHLCRLRCESPACVRIIGRDDSASGWLRRSMDHLRAAWRARLWETLGERRAPIAAAILLGDRSALPRENSQLFRQAGALHVLVVSGLHAGVVVSVVFIAMGVGVVPRRLAIALAMLLVAGYAYFTGAHPPVMRAAMLAELAFVALWYERNPLAMNSLAAAVLVVLAINPADLFRTGAQLSFLCAAVLLWFSSVRWHRRPTPLEKLIRETRPWPQKLLKQLTRWATLVMAATLAVWVVSLPLLAYQFHLVAPVAILASPLLFPAVVATLLAGFAFLVIGWIVPIAAAPLAAICDLAVGWLDSVVTYSSAMPGGHLWTSGPAGWWVAGWFALTAVLLCNGGTRWGWRRTIQLAAAWVVIGAIPVLARSQVEQPMQVTFLDVGHGAAIVITTPDGATLLYDAGSIGSPRFATETVSNYLWSRGIRTIDGIVISHADIDHFNAVPGLLDRFRVGRVFVSPMMFARRPDPNDHSAPEELRRLLESHGVPIEVVRMGDRLTLDRSTHADVLYPDQLGNLGSDNANSLVLALEHRGRRVLLPGDLESPGIDALLADQPYDCDLLLVPHHGSRRSDPPGLAAWSRPEWVVISAGGSKPTAPEVAASYQQQGAQVLTTHQSGAITFAWGEGEVEVETFVE